MNMRSYAPKISDNVINLAEQIDKQVQQKKESSKFNSILEVLIDSWVSGRIVRVIQSLKGFDPIETELAPYFIGFREEDSGGRHPISVTGRLRHTTEIVTIDISTITSATILNENLHYSDKPQAFNCRRRWNAMKAGYDTSQPQLKERSFHERLRSVVTDPGFTKNSEGALICTWMSKTQSSSIGIIQCGDSARDHSRKTSKKVLQDAQQDPRTV